MLIYGVPVAGAFETTYIAKENLVSKALATGTLVNEHIFSSLVYSCTATPL